MGYNIRMGNDLPAKVTSLEREGVMLRLAREIAMDILPIETILAMYELTPEDLEEIKQSTYFQRVLQGELEAWNCAVNTKQRVEIKSASLVEHALAAINTLIHDTNQSASARVEAVKTVAKLGNLGLTNVADGGGGEMFKVVINLGADSKLSIEKQLPPKVIDMEPVNGAS